MRGTLRGMPPHLPDLLPVHRHPRPLWLRLLFFFGALVCFGLGVVGWLIPVVTGIPFYVAAIVLLAMASERARGWVNTLERRLAHDTRVAMRRWLHSHAVPETVCLTPGQGGWRARPTRRGRSGPRVVHQRPRRANEAKHERILTTHVGSLARPDALIPALRSKDRGQPYDREVLRSAGPGGGVRKRTQADGGGHRRRHRWGARQGELLRVHRRTLHRLRAQAGPPQGQEAVCGRPAATIEPSPITTRGPSASRSGRVVAGAIAAMASMFARGRSATRARRRYRRTSRI